ncbi:MAG TPA: cation transporter [Actinomycetota bacterium]|nr:cation transporter [Actinomycetota bacterium]
MQSDLRRAFWLEYATIAWNAVEAAIALTFGFLAGSLALTAFGIDSVIEVFAAVVVLIELRGHERQGEEHGPARIFLGLIGGSFFLLATYVLIQATWDLLAQARPDPSIPGIVLTSASLATMWFLAMAKHRTGHRINCRPLIADSQETRLCALLSAVTLAGLVLNAIFGWWWADPVAALGIAVLAGVEGYEALSGQHPEHH